MASIESIQKQIAELEAKLQKTRERAQERLGREFLDRVEKRCSAVDVELQIVDLWKLIRDPDVVGDDVIDRIIAACHRAESTEPQDVPLPGGERSQDAVAPSRSAAGAVDEGRNIAQR